MAHKRFKLSHAGEERLNKIMAELDLVGKRPEAMRIAFAKGLAGINTLPNIDEIKHQSGRFEVPTGVIATGDDYLLVQHIIIEKARRPLDNKAVDEYISYLLEEGLKIMVKEINSLTELDNYLLYLVDQCNNK